MSSSEDSDIDLECGKIARLRKFSPKFIASLEQNDVQTPIEEIFSRFLKFRRDQTDQESKSSRYARRLPIAFKILKQGMEMLTPGHGKLNEDSSQPTKDSSQFFNDSACKEKQKAAKKLKLFQQDLFKKELHPYEQDEVIRKRKLTDDITRNNMRQSRTDKIFHTTLGNRPKEKAPSSAHRHRTQIIREFVVSGNRIRTNWHKGLINGYTEIDYKDAGKFRGIFKQGEIVSGEMTFPNGFVYTGEFSMFNFHGVGKLKFPSGQVFQGNWLFGSLIGDVKITYPQGQIYFGKISNFKREGQGYLYFPNGEKYVGEFLQGEITGFGELHKDGACSRRGFWVDGKFVGDEQEKFNKRKRQRQVNRKSSVKGKPSISDEILTSLGELKQKHESMGVNAFGKVQLMVSFNEDMNQEFMSIQDDIQSQSECIHITKTTTLSVGVV